MVTSLCPKSDDDAAIRFSEPDVIVDEGPWSECAVCDDDECDVCDCADDCATDDKAECADSTECADNAVFDEVDDDDSDGGRSAGLHGECEFVDELPTPLDDEYKSWLNWKRRKQYKRKIN